MDRLLAILERSIRIADAAGTVRALPSEYQMTAEESFASREMYAAQLAHNDAIRHASTARAAKTATQC